MQEVWANSNNLWASKLDSCTYLSKAISFKPLFLFEKSHNRKLQKHYCSRSPWVLIASADKVVSQRLGTKKILVRVNWSSNSSSLAKVVLPQLRHYYQHYCLWWNCRRSWHNQTYHGWKSNKRTAITFLCHSREVKTMKLANKKNQLKMNGIWDRYSICIMDLPWLLPIH